MKSRIIWAAVVLAAMVAFYVMTIRPAQYSSPGFSQRHPPPVIRKLPPPDIPPPRLPEPVVAMPTITPPPLPARPITPPDIRKPMPPAEVPIQDNVTIDFSYGGPQIRTDGKNQEALDKALKEMAEATKNVTFPPRK